MKKITLFFGAAAAALLIVIAGCSLPAAEMQGISCRPTDGDQVIGGDNDPPPVYEVKLNSNYSYYPSLAWNQTNNEYGAAWVNNRYPSGIDIYFSRINASGAKLMNDVRIAKGDDSWLDDPSLAWNSKQNEYGLVWYKSGAGNGSKIYFVRISAEGKKIGDTMVLDKGGWCRQAYITYNSTNDEYGVVWDKTTGDDDRGYGIYFSRLDKDGNILTTYDGEKKTGIQDSYKIGSTSVWNQTAALVWNPDSKEYGITFTRHAANEDEFHTYVYFITRNRKGGMDSDAVFMKLDDVGVNASFSQVVWAQGKQQYNVVWFDSARIRGQLIDKNGNKVGGRITYPKFSDGYLSHPCIIWNTKAYQYCVCWHTADHVRFIRADENGQYISGSGKEIGNEYSGSSVLAWNKTDNEYGICWYNTGGDEGIYFAHLDKNGSEQPQGIVTGAITGSMPGTYYIRSVVYGTYLSDIIGDNPVLAHYVTGYADRQQWELQDNNNDGYYKITNKATGRYITGYLSDGSPAQPLGLVTSGGDHYKWWIYSYDDHGSYMFRLDNYTSYRIYATGETTVKLKTSAKNQKKWQLVPAGY
jgi:hypothetical protein